MLERDFAAANSNRAGLSHFYSPSIELLRAARNDVICPINGIRLLFADDEGQYVDIDNNTTLLSLCMFTTDKRNARVLSIEFPHDAFSRAHSGILRRRLSTYTTP